MAKHSNMQIMPHDSTGTLFSDEEDHGKIHMGSPPTGATNAGRVG